MECTILETKCRLCGTPFDEVLCLDGKGSAWVELLGPSPEDGNPWCPRCLQRMNEICNRLCAEIPLFTEKEG